MEMWICREKKKNPKFLAITIKLNYSKILQAVIIETVRDSDYSASESGRMDSRIEASNQC